MNVGALSPDKLRRDLGHMASELAKTADIPPLEGIVGQDRAVSALKFGLSNKALGYNIYVSGLPGTGKLSAVKHYLSILASANGDKPSDWCYVYNFKDAYCPRYIELPQGKAAGFKTDMEAFTTEAKQTLLKVLQSDEYTKRREEIIKGVDARRQKVFSEVSEKAEQEGFVIKQTVMGIFAFPVIDGKVVDEETFGQLPEKKQQELAHKKQELQGDLNEMMYRLRDVERVAQQELVRLEEEVAAFTIGPVVGELLRKYEGLDEVVAYIQEVRDDLLRNLYDFLEVGKEENPAAMMQAMRKEPKYQVNVLVDNSDAKGVPLVVELNPTYTNLFGKVEKESVMGTLYTDFTLIRGGSTHRANGGYLIIPADELLRNMFSYDSLKRALRSQRIEIEEAGEKLGFMTTKSLKPESIPFDIKVILVGEPMLYQLLYHYDKDFRELFKVKADFGSDMPASEENIKNYFGFVSFLCQEECIGKFDSGALVKIAEYGMRLAGSQKKLSTRFGELADIIRETGFYAARRKDGTATAEDVVKAIEDKAYRSNLLQEKIQEMIADGSIYIDMEGERTGQVNGLAVIDLGDVMFGRPNRITAITAIGSKGVIDIEREAELGGPLHTKGVLILNGYLAGKYGKDRPLALSASLVFEQSYGAIDGDSASSAELYALLSSLSGKPIRQGIAVTGSVNQYGEVQPIGGVNEKIEGFFEVCRNRGFTGDQGVMIPQSNVQNLMLKEEVVEAVKAGKFHVWPVETIDQGIEILTGVKGGTLLKEGGFEPGSINDLVDKRLREMAEQIKQFAAANQKKNGA